MRLYCTNSTVEKDRLNHDMTFALNRSKVVDCLNQAIMLDHENQFLYYNRGCALLVNKDYAHAIDDFYTCHKYRQRTR